MPPIIQLNQVTKTFSVDGQPFNALDGVSLEVQKGEIFGIIGLSAASIFWRPPRPVPYWYAVRS